MAFSSTRIESAEKTDAGRVAPIRACVSCSAFQAAACKRGSEVRKNCCGKKKKQ